MIWADDSHFIHPFETLLTNLIPPDFVFTPVLGDIFRPGMKRVVRSSVGKVKDEGFVFSLVFIKTVDCVISKGVGVIELLVRASVAHDHFVLDGPTP